LGEITAGIAHEIQNPLNFVNNFSELNVELSGELKKELDDTNLPMEQKASLGVMIGNIIQNQEKIVHHGKRADAIVKGMLEHSRSNAGNKEERDINALVEEYLRLSYHGFKAKNKSFEVEIKTDLDETIGKVAIVPQDIGRVLVNLFNNAFYSVYTKKQSSGVAYQPLISASTKKNDNKVEIRIRDNGLGIPEKILPKIFQPFYTTKPTWQGTGLGLSLSYDIIKAHGGDLKVDTRVGEFAAFTVIL
jgi:two-component system NtrC family sensor kinase